jgi:hypothetical protein
VTAFLGKFNIKEIKKLQTTVHHLLPRELSEAEVDRSGLGPRFNLFDSKTGILEDALLSLSICIAIKSVLN